MYWSTINFIVLVRDVFPVLQRKIKTLALWNAFVAPLEKIKDETLYKMQHDGRTMYLEKMLNESFDVSGYDHQDHENTKLIYIDDLPEVEKLYIFQNEETGVSFLEDDDDENEDDIFLDGDNEGNIAYSWIIFIPDTIPFEELKLRALVDSYRYFGKKYTIQTYEL